MMNVPQFLYVPRINTLGATKLIIETRRQIYWQVVDFFDDRERQDWLENNQHVLQSALAINAHREYPFLLLCIDVREEIDSDRLVKLGNLASDWYAQFYLRNKKLTKPMFDDGDNRAKEYFKHWVWGDNLISQSGAVYLINLEYGVSIKFDYGDAFFASFEDFENSISDVQFLNGERPDEATVEQLVVDAWNFMGLQECIEEGLDFDDEEIFP